MANSRKMNAHADIDKISITQGEVTVNFNQDKKTEATIKEKIAKAKFVENIKVISNQLDDVLVAANKQNDNLNKLLNLNNRNEVTSTSTRKFGKGG